MKKHIFLIGFLFLFSPVMASAGDNCNIEEGEEKTFLEVFEDEGLAECVAENLEKEKSDVVRKNELLEIKELDCWFKNISSISSLGCFEEIKKLNLHNNNIKDINREFFLGMRNLEELDIGLNSIINIEDESFSSLENLKTLYLGENKIIDIDKNDFKGLVNLKKLRLSKNEISSIKRESFSELKNLEELYLGWNKIDNIPEGVFQDLHNLEYLGLQWNLISELKEGHFVNLKKLQILEIEKNNIISIDKKSFKDLTNLRRLGFWANSIKEIDEKYFSELKKLEYLDLSANEIKIIKKEYFLDLINLQELNLGANQINKIDQDSFNNLENLEILHLWNNELSDIDYLKGIINLEVLHISQNDNINCIFEEISSISTLTLPEHLEQKKKNGENIYCDDESNTKVEIEGYSNKEAEEKITEEIKNKIENLNTVSSESQNGVSQINIEFEDSKSFSDITPSTKFSNAISYLKEKNYVQGFDDGTFRPENKISRYAFTKIVVNAKFSQEEIKNCNQQEFLTFPDVPKDDWFSPFVCMAKKEGIINGYSDGTFGGSNNVTSPEALKIILETYEFDPAKYETDGEWYERYQQSAKNFGLTKGISDSPEYFITRGEMAEFIYKMEEIYKALEKIKNM